MHACCLSVHVQASIRGQEQCEEVGVKLEQAWNRGELHLIGVPELGMCACTRFPEDNKLCRVRITGREQGNPHHTCVQWNCNHLCVSECVLKSYG